MATELRCARALLFAPFSLLLCTRAAQAQPSHADPMGAPIGAYEDDDAQHTNETQSNEKAQHERGTVHLEQHVQNEHHVQTEHDAPTEAPTQSAVDSARDHEQVRVRGRRADNLKRNSGSGTIITEEEIKRAQPESMGELIKRVPGLQVRQEDAMGLRLNIGVRGLSPRRSRLVLIEEDGVPVVVSPYGEPELYYMPAVERIQQLDVIKGSDVLRYGPQTVGAIVRLRTWEATERPSWLLSATGGSLLNGQMLARYSGTHQGIGVVLQAMHKGGEGYRKMGFSASDVLGKIRFFVSPRSEIRLKLAFHNQHAKTTYTGLTDTLYRQNPRRDTIAPNDYFAIRRLEAAITHEHRFSENAKLSTSLFAYEMDTGLRLQSFDRMRFPLTDYERIADPEGLYFRHTTNLRSRIYSVAGLSSELEGRVQTGQVGHKILGGMRVIGESTRRRYSIGAFPTAESGDLQTDDTTRIFGFGAWLQDQIAFSDHLLLTPAFRLEHASTGKRIHRQTSDTRAPFDTDQHASASSTGAMPGLGLILGSPKFNVFSSLHLGYSAPRVSQSITPDGRDANLDAERSSNYELGARGKIGRWLLAEGNVFWVNFDNQLVSNNPLSGFTSEFINGGRTRHLGAEATARARIGKALRWPLDVDLSASYTFVRSRFVGGTWAGKTIPYAPQNTLQATLDLLHRSGVSGQIAFTFVGRQFTDERNTVEGGPTGLDGAIPAFATLDLGARYRHRRSGLALGLSAKNLLDRVYISDRLPNGIFTAGFRQFFATLSWSRP